VIELCTELFVCIVAVYSSLRCVSSAVSNYDNLLVF
jgi:hypothetical protein